jgi:hypothetical protein
MPRCQVKSRVDAAPVTVWAVLLDKMEHPQRYIEDALDAEILGREPDGVIRQLVLPGGVVFRERITANPESRTITFTLLDHPIYEGTVTNQLLTAPDGTVELVFVLDWKVRPGCAEAREVEALPGLIQSSILQTRRIAETLETSF